MWILAIFFGWMAMVALTIYAWIRFAGKDYVLERLTELDTVLLVVFLWFLALPVLCFMRAKDLFGDHE